MGFVAWFLGRDLRARGERPSRVPRRARGALSRLSTMTQPPSLSAVRSALSRADGAGQGALGPLRCARHHRRDDRGPGGGRLRRCALHIDLSMVDEHAVGDAAPVLLLGIGLLASFPISGWLVARAAGVRTLLEPALACVLALVVTLVALGFAAPFTVVFALALSPIAWVLSCVGAWMGGRRDGGPGTIRPLGLRRRGGRGALSPEDRRDLVGPQRNLR